MYRISRAASGRYTANRIKRWAQPLTRRQLLQAARALWPMLATLAFAGVAHAQGTMDFSGATTLMSTFKTFAIYAGAIICFGGLIFAGIRMMSGRFQDAIPGLFGALFGAGVLGWGAGWIGFDHGYAVTSHSSQGLTAGRVLANIDTDSSRSLINSRLAYVAISRASEDARIYTNNAETLGQRLATDISKTAAVDFRPSTEQTREAVSAFRSNDPAKATELLQKQERVYEYANPDHRIAAVALDYTARPDRAIIVAPSSAERKELTQLIRAELQAQGKISAESHSVPVLFEQKYSNPKLAASYSPGDQIHYRTGSPSIEGIPHDSTATVLSTNAKKNVLTIETRDGEQISYNPIQLRQQTRQGIVYRQGELNLSVGERITFTRPDRENRIRSGDFATLEKVGDNNALTVRMDNGRKVTLEAEKAKHIDYGYTVEKAKRLSADRIVLTGDSAQLAEQQAALTKLNPKVRDLAIYTSDSANALHKDHGIANGSLLTKEGISNAPNLGNLSEPSSPAIELEGYGIGM